MANGPGQNATVEEILASIRQAISDDDTKRESDRGRVDARAPLVKPSLFDAGQDTADEQLAKTTANGTGHGPAIGGSAQSAPSQDVIELAIEQALDGVRAELEGVVAATPSRDRQAADLTPLREAPRLGGVMGGVSPTRREVPPLQPRRTLLSAQTDARVSASFEDLAKAMSSGGARQLDGVVEDLLRPMLREWLENNLPHMVERLVREEIERVSRGGRR